MNNDAMLPLRKIVIIFEQLIHVVVSVFCPFHIHYSIMLFYQKISDCAIMICKCFSKNASHKTYF